MSATYIGCEPPRDGQDVRQWSNVVGKDQGQYIPRKNWFAETFGLPTLALEGRYIRFASDLNAAPMPIITKHEGAGGAQELLVII